MVRKKPTFSRSLATQARKGGGTRARKAIRSVAAVNVGAKRGVWDFE